MENRKYNYELLRILSTIAVVAIHVSSNYLTAFTDDNWLNGLYTEHVFINILYNASARFAVPCFIMLSGTFALENAKNADYKYYYRKIFRSIGIPTALFSILYFIYRILKEALAIIVKGYSEVGLSKWGGG